MESFLDNLIGKTLLIDLHFLFKIYWTYDGM